MLQPIKRDFLIFPTEAGVNTNQSEWPSQGQFYCIVSTAEKNSKIDILIKGKGDNRRLFNQLAIILNRFYCICDTMRKFSHLRFVFAFYHYTN
ncbi:hypothetical protein DX038_00510 [Escherichia albertii]|nr:hypothetical protein [Escherichia albertii]